MMPKISDMVIAMQGWGQNVAPSMEKPKGLWGREIIIKSGNVTIDGNQLDVEFNIPFDDNTEANEAEIVIYNLTDSTISNIKIDANINVTAGYTNDTGIIFSGKVSQVKTKWVGVDKKTTISAIDSSDLKERKLASKTYAKGTKASYILKDLIGELSLPIAEFTTKTDKTFTDSVTVEGNIKEQIEKYAKICGVSAYVLKGRVYVRDVRKGEEMNFEINADTGLIGSPEEFEESEQGEDFKSTAKGYSCEMLLQHRLTVASKIKLKSREVNGTFSVRSGEHKFDGTNFITAFKCIS